MRISIHRLINMLESLEGNDNTFINLTRDKEDADCRVVLPPLLYDRLQNASDSTIDAEMDKDKEINEYSIRENLFFVALESEKMRDALKEVSHEEIMAEAISIAEEFENTPYDRNGDIKEQLVCYARSRLSKMKNKDFC